MAMTDDAARPPLDVETLAWALDDSVVYVKLGRDDPEGAAQVVLARLRAESPATGEEHRPSAHFEDGSPPVCVVDDETWPCHARAALETGDGT